MTIKFDTIWQNYPDNAPCRDSRTGKIPSGYEDQCAMRLGFALERSGVSFASFRGKRCPCGPKSGGMVAGAQQLADWLVAGRFPGCPRAETYAGATVFDNVKNRTGIVFLSDYWQRKGETGSTRTGDHIDLWNGARMTSYSSWLRVHLGVALDGVWSDFRRSPKVLFWAIA